MKKILGAAVAVLVTAGLAAAQVSAPQGSTPGQNPGMTSQAPDKDKAKASSDKTEISADVVSVDATAKTITIRKADSSASGESKQMTLPVDASAQSSLSKVSAGDRVKLSCTTDSAGTQRVTKLSRVTDARPATDQPPGSETPRP